MKKNNVLLIIPFILMSCIPRNKTHTDENLYPKMIQIEFTSEYLSSIITIIPDGRYLLINERGFPNFTYQENRDSIKLLPDFKSFFIDSVKMNNIIALSKEVLKEEKQEKNLPIINGLIDSRYLLLTNIIILNKDSSSFYVASIDYEKSNFSKSKSNLMTEVLDCMIENSKDSFSIEYYEFTKRRLKNIKR